MGCDIHMMLEARENGIWQNKSELSNDEWRSGNEPYPKSQPWDGRNYVVFGILAGVRSNLCEPIAPPRGMPFDAHPITKQFMSDYDHTPSWLSLRDIIEYDWTQTIEDGGYVNAYNWAKWRDTGKPYEWSGLVSGSTVIHVEPEDFEAAWQNTIKALGLPETRWPSSHLYQRDGEATKHFLRQFDSPNVYTHVSWKEPLYDRTHHFYGTLVPKLMSISGGNPDNARIVFYFDS